GHYTWQINNVSGTEGADPGWSKLYVNGGLTISANSGSKFNIDITSLTAGDVPGIPAGLTPATAYTWHILTASGGISGFSPDAFNLNTGNFSGGGASGTFAIVQNGSDLNLTFTPPLKITGVTVLANQTMQLSLLGTAGSNYVIQATTNLAPPATWVNLSTNMAGTDGTFQYIDVGATNIGQQFYRLTTP
ncbi:MAG TPA: hypothetical protein VFC07_13220, partial [Verrucomicrobiae bacterium]|nr:hypothetical protein [Verrucomicrobiae bacterium]